MRDGLGLLRGAAWWTMPPCETAVDCMRWFGKDMADRLHLEAGDRVLAVETDRGILLTPFDPEAERALRVAAKAAKTYRNALRELAK